MLNDVAQAESNPLHIDHGACAWVPDRSAAKAFSTGIALSPSATMGIKDTASGWSRSLELPIAALCFWVARNLAHAVEIARAFLQAAGFTIADNKRCAAGKA